MQKSILTMLFLLLVGLGAMSAPAADSGDTEPQSGSRPLTIVTLGDSITKGVRGGVTAEQTFAARLETQLQPSGVPVRVINVGIGGERSDQALQRLDQIIELEPDIVTVMYGTNDSYVDQGRTETRITLDEYRHNLTKIITEFLRRGILPILMTEPRWADDARANGVGENPNIRLEPYVVACRETARAWRVPLVDHFARWSELRKEGINLREWTTDGCHPNPVGHQELAALMLRVIRQAIGPELKIRAKLRLSSQGEREPDENAAAAGTAAAIRVVCFGDSVTGVYYHTGSRRAYTDMLGIALRRAAPRARIEMVNAGISGHTTVNALERIERDVLSHKPDLVTVMFGLNDMTRVPLDQYRANLQEIVARCRAAGSEVVLSTPNNVISTSGRPTERLVQYCDVVREVGGELNVPVCDAYRELDAVREHDAIGWRLLMSDAIHPNMDGHKRLAIALAQTITGRRIALDDVSPPQPAIAATLELLRGGNPVRVLAMPPFDQLIGSALGESFPDAEIQVETWLVGDASLAKIEQDAKTRVRSTKPDLVLIAVPAAAGAENEEAFASSFAWIMNWSLNFGQPTWDCVVVHPSVVEPAAELGDRDDLIRRLVRAQDLRLIDRPSGSQADAASVFRAWFKDAVDSK